MDSASQKGALARLFFKAQLEKTPHQKTKMPVRQLELLPLHDCKSATKHTPLGAILHK